MEKMEKTAEEIRLEAEQNIKNLAIETTKACLLYTSYLETGILSDEITPILTDMYMKEMCIRDSF